jgi:DNA-binding response OmpR family regulator
MILPADAAHHGDIAIGLDAGANDCVRTPVSDAELQARIVLEAVPRRQ